MMASLIFFYRRVTLGHSSGQLPEPGSKPCLVCMDMLDCSRSSANETFHRIAFEPEFAPFVYKPAGLDDTASGRE